MKPVPVFLVIGPDYPDLPGLRRNLRAALQAMGWMPAWQEVLAGDAALPARFRARPGPFVLAGQTVIEPGTAATIAAALQQLPVAAARRAWWRLPAATGSAMPGILLAFFPKCAGCWAAYCSVLGSVGIGLPYLPWMRHVLAATLVVSALYFARMARRRNRWLPFAFQMSGFAAVLGAQYLLGASWLLWLGVGLVFVGSLLYAMPDAWLRRLEFGLRNARIGLED